RLQHEYVSSPNTYSARVPTDGERLGDFSQTLSSQGTPLVVYNPYSTVVNGTTVTRQPFPGNKIPASLLNPTGVAIINEYPKANVTAPARIGLYNWVAPGGSSVPATQVSQRIDQAVGS